MTQLTFPEGFIWGTATSSYQIEGAWNLDGKGESIWDRFSHTPGKVVGGDNGDVACDHYHRFSEDVEIMRRLGVNSYRFSVSWPRVLPEGRGPVNRRGIEFYERLVDTLLAAGIEPALTLYHWDLPQALQEKGGWENRDVCAYFADYAALVARRLGDRVRIWTTINEPWVIAKLGNRTGEHAPGLKDARVTLQVGHNLMVAHGLAMQALRAEEARLQAGIVLSLWPTESASDRPEDVEAAEFDWQKENGWFLSPLLNGSYPSDVLHSLGGLAPAVKPGDMALVSQPTDLLGVNYYSRTVMAAGGPVRPVPGSEYTDMGWEVQAPALRRLLGRMTRDYRCPPLYITENGCAYRDELSTDGNVHDSRRIKFFHEHLKACHDAITDGVDLRGFYAWSMMDNFEWAYGYSKRFGLVYVDYPTQRRVIKDSGEWYAQVIGNNGLPDLSESAAITGLARYVNE